MSESAMHISWRPLVEAAGFYSVKQSDSGMHKLAGMILRDPVVSVRAGARIAAYQKERFTEESYEVLSFEAKNMPDFYVVTLNEMSAEEKGAFRQRILDAVGRRSRNTEVKAR